MADKYETISQLTTDTAEKLTGSYQEWTAFLTTAARLYKYPFLEQVMIYAQRPEATACADYDVWNRRMRRYIRRGSAGIALIDNSGNRPALRYVFDITDTGGGENAKRPYLWQFREDHRQAVMDALENRYGVPAADGLDEQLEQAATQLAAQFWDEYRDKMDIVADCITERADTELRIEQERREALRNLPLYPYPGDYAREHNELELYRESRRANVACRDAIDKAISENYRDNCLDCKAAVAQVVEQFGYERMLHICACTIRDKEWDGRISQDNIQWAHTVPIFEDNDGFGFNRRVDYIVDRSHPGLTDMFVKAARREYLLTQPLTPEEIRAEALNILSQFQDAREPNSPSGTHYAARVTPFFLERANGKAADMLGKFLPFQSLTFTTFTDRRGVYAVIAKHEDRSRKLRPVRASVLEKLQKPLSPTSPKHSAKSREQEL